VHAAYGHPNLNHDETQISPRCIAFSAIQRGHRLAIWDVCWEQAVYRLSNGSENVTLKHTSRKDLSLVHNQIDVP
jgi:hypothetical protein